MEIISLIREQIVTEGLGTKHAEVHACVVLLIDGLDHIYRLVVTESR